MKEGELQVAPKQSSVQRKVFLKIGRPGYRVTKVRDREAGKEGMMVQIHLPQIKDGVVPRRRFMSAWEQKREPPNKSYQYLIVRAPAYHAVFVLLLIRIGLPPGRWLRSPMRLSRSASQLGRLKTSWMMEATGIGHIGIQTPNNTVSSSCSVKPSDSVLYSLFLYLTIFHGMRFSVRKYRSLSCAQNCARHHFH
jgi:Pre-mRNA-splicing factor SF3a complex subunit 2 (Prp11)